MTEPIELLEERLSEIIYVKNIAEKNDLGTEEMNEINLMYNKYSVCIELLRLALRDDFVYKGEPKKTSMEMYINQSNKIRYLNKLLAQKHK
jgi:hypothetical protein